MSNRMTFARNLLAVWAGCLCGTFLSLLTDGPGGWALGIFVGENVGLIAAFLLFPLEAHET